MPARPRVALVIALAIAPSLAVAQNRGDGEVVLAKLNQNPVARMVKIPAEWMFVSGGAVGDQTTNTLTFKPVVPTDIGMNTMLVFRTLVPFVNAPAADSSRVTGVGNVQEQMFFTPARPGPVIWAFGPMFTFPTASNQSEQNGDWGLGPCAVLMRYAGRWVFGALLTQSWTLSSGDTGKELNQFTAEPFVHVNMPHGFTISSEPKLKANWMDASGDVWTVPLGGGLSKVTSIGSQRMSIALYYYKYVERPSSSGDDELKMSVTLLFPSAARR